MRLRSMKNKIVITGALGYIGTELCKLYSGHARSWDIVAIDNRFVSERVKQLSDWGIRFVHGDIMDFNLLRTEFADADVVIHLAGITDVAYTKTEANDELDNKIITTAVQGTRNVIDAMKSVTLPNAVLLFPSTHVVYEGFPETVWDIPEERGTRPVLSYSIGKNTNELDIRTSNINYVILRLGSVYGYSTDTMRIGIMPNLFSKITSQNGTIKLFGGGKQLKSVVNIHDVARCFQFMAERPELWNNIYHCTDETITVKEVAEMCKEYAGDRVNIITTDDEVPNLGYSLSNTKLLNTGFKFSHNLAESIAEMVDNWTKSDVSEPTYTFPGGNKFVDSRGVIANYELPESINMVGVISSVRGTVRANHYHPIQEQKCILISGQYVGVYLDLEDPNAIVQTRLINEGDCEVIRPNVAHAMVFLEDSTFINLVRGERNHENYGVTHTIPYEVVNSQLAKNIIKTYKTYCRVCGNIELLPYVSLGLSPLANELLDNPTDPDKFPLEVVYCPECHNSQLSCAVPSSMMFDNYLYTSSTTETLRKHFSDAAEFYKKKFKLTNNSIVLDIGSNDGVTLQAFKDLGIPALGVEPAKNLVDIASAKGLPTFHGYFDDEMADELYNEWPIRYDLILASNVFAHADNLRGIARNIRRLLKQSGTAIIEVQYILDTIQGMSFDNIYHEHFNYWSVTSLKTLLEDERLRIAGVEYISTHGGSIRVYIRRDDSPTPLLYEVDKIVSADDAIEYEIASGLHMFDTYKRFGEEVEKVKQRVKENIVWLFNTGFPIVGYGSPAKATTALNYFGVDSGYIDYIIEDNALKQGKWIPGVNIPIRSKEGLDKDNEFMYVIIMAWNFEKEIIAKNSYLNGGNVRFLTIYDLRMEHDKFRSFIRNG